MHSEPHGAAHKAVRGVANAMHDLRPRRRGAQRLTPPWRARTPRGRLRRWVYRPRRCTHSPVGDPGSGVGHLDARHTYIGEGESREEAKSWDAERQTGTKDKGGAGKVERCCG